MNGHKCETYEERELRHERMARAYGVYGPAATIKLANEVVKPVSSQEEPECKETNK